MNKEQNRCISCYSNLSIFMEGIFDNRFGVVGSYNIYKCNKCELVQIWPRPSVSEILKLYNNYYSFGYRKNDLYIKLRTAFFNSSLYCLWMGLDGDTSFYSKRGKGRLLDIGCNEGRGLPIYKNNGFIVEGLEVNEIAANEARNYGFKVYTNHLENFQPQKLYDIVVLSNVLEHSLIPKEMLKHINRILNPGGQVWISCPNVNSWQRKLFGKFWINWHVPFHIVHFTLNSLTILLQETGFKVEEISQESPALWVSQSLIARFFARPGKPTKHLRNSLLIASLMFLIRCLLFPLLSIGNILGRGDCLVVTSRKTN